MSYVARSEEDRLVPAAVDATGRTPLSNSGKQFSKDSIRSPVLGTRVCDIGERTRSGRGDAQELLVLLAQLVYNLTSWTVRGLAAQMSPFVRRGVLRIVRAAFHIDGRIILEVDGHIEQVTLNMAQIWAKISIRAFSPFLAGDLRKLQWKVVESK